MRNIVITGASSGIGAATALRLDGLGMRVFAGIRKKSDGEALAAKASPTLQPIQLDVTDDDSVTRAAQHVADVVGDDHLWGLVNNAGQGYPGPLETLPIRDLQDQLEVNLIGHVRVTQAFLPEIRAARGRVVFVGSLGGKVAFTFAGPYHASKFAIEGVADVWRQELHPEGIAVSVIEPGVMATGIWGKSIARIDDMLADPNPALDRYRDRLAVFRENLASGDSHGSSPDDVAKVIEKALTSRWPATRYPVGLTARAVTTLVPLIPDKLVDLGVRRFRS